MKYLLSLIQGSKRFIQDWQEKHLFKHRSLFLKRVAELVREGYSLYDAIYLLLPHHHPQYEKLLSRIQQAFSSGCSPSELFEELGFSKKVLLPILLAEQDGRLEQTLHRVAERVNRQEQQQRQFIQLSLYPIFLFICITILLLAFRHFFIPNMHIFTNERIEGNTRYSLLPILVTRIPDLFISLFVWGGGNFIALHFWYARQSAKRKLLFWMKIPLIRTLVSKQITRDFCYEGGQLLITGFSLQQMLEVLRKQTYHPILSEIAQDLRQSVLRGDSFAQAIEGIVALMPQLVIFIKHGEARSHLPQELIIYSNQLGEELNTQFERGLALLQPTLFLLVAACIIAAYLALLLPIYDVMNKM